MKRISNFWFVFAVLLLSAPQQVLADTFGSGSNAFEIEFVPIPSVGEYVINRRGDTAPGNPPDSSGSPSRAGAVPYSYRIGKYEISESMIDKANALGGLGITKDTRGPDKPATSISWFEAAKFVNWLNTSTDNTPAYKFVDVLGPRGSVIGIEFALWEPTDLGYNPDNLFRNRLARYVLPSTDEWYKAAYYDPVGEEYNRYPTGPGIPTAVLSGTDPGTAVFTGGAPFPTGPADIMQAGGLSRYGTMAQGGNVSEWLETQGSDAGGSRNGRGGGWGALLSSMSNTSGGGSALLQQEFIGTGFRVASIPEPTSLVLAFVATLAHLLPRNSQ